MNQHGSASGVTLAVVAIIISGLALVLSWIAYDRTGDDLTDQIDTRVEQSLQELNENVQQGAQEVQEEVQQGAQELDEGPDNVDEDDTDTQQNTNGDTTTQ